jgi:ketosteroid isomerase-like protein
MNTPKIVTDEVAAIMSNAEKYKIAANSGNLDMWLETCTQDIVFQPPDHPQVSGKESVAKWAKENFFDPFHMELNFEFEEIEILGTWAFSRGKFTLKLTPAGGGNETASTGKFLNIFRRESYGSWYYARASFSFDAPLTAAQ